MAGAEFPRADVIESRSRSATVAGVILALGVVCGVLCSFFVHPSTAAALAVAIGALSVPALIAHTPPARWRLGADAVEVQAPETRLIPYESIENVAVLFNSLTKQLRARGVALRANGQWWVCPKLPTRAAESFAQTLVEKVGFRRADDLPADLLPVATGQDAQFGPERVFCFAASAPRPGRRAALTAAWTVAVAISAGALVAALSGLTPTSNAFTAGFCTSVAILAVGLLIALTFREGTPMLKNSGLLISPLGITLIQGELKGQLQWQELRSVRMTRAQVLNRGFAAARILPCIQLRVDGAEIQLIDIYDRPLTTLADLISMFWKNELRCRRCAAPIPAATGPTCGRCNGPTTAATAGEPAVAPFS